MCDMREREPLVSEAGFPAGRGRCREGPPPVVAVYEIILVDASVSDLLCNIDQAALVAECRSHSVPAAQGEIGQRDLEKPETEQADYYDQ